MKSKAARLKRFRVQYPDDLKPNVVRAEDFKTLTEAIAAGERTHGPFLVMAALEGTDGRYAWEVLPHGTAGGWRAISGAYRLRWQLGVGLSAAALSLLILYGGDDTKQKS